MTRSSKLALVTLLAGLLSLASAATVSADNYCAAGAQEQCIAASLAQVPPDATVVIAPIVTDAGPTA